MKELNLQVGQKVWSIQLGECVMEIIYDNFTYPIICRNIEGKSCSYTSDGYMTENDAYPSLFESNPFERSVDTNETIEPKLVRQQNDVWVESKAETINALCNICNVFTAGKIRTIAVDKLQKLLESL